MSTDLMKHLSDMPLSVEMTKCLNGPWLGRHLPVFV